MILIFVVVMVVFWWLWLLIAGVCYRGLNWSFDGVWCWDLAVICSMDCDFEIFCNKICLDTEKITEQM